MRITEGDCCYGVLPFVWVMFSVSTENCFQGLCCVGIHLLGKFGDSQNWGPIGNRP